MPKPWRLNLSLTQMGLLLVFIPLAMGLIFIGTLSFFLQRSQLEAERHLLSKAIISQANVVSRLFVDASLAMSSYCLTGVPIYSDRYAATKQSLYDELVKLDALKVSDETERNLLKSISDKAMKGTGLLDNSRQVLDNFGNDNLVTRQQLKEIRSVAGVLEPDMEELTAFEKASEKESSTAESGASGLLRYALMAGVILNICVSIGVALVLRNFVLTRLNVMRDNSFRLSRRESLNPALEGTDEIADLDKAFSRDRPAPSMKHIEKNERWWKTPWKSFVLLTIGCYIGTESGRNRVVGICPGRTSRSTFYQSCCRTR